MLAQYGKHEAPLRLATSKGSALVIQGPIWAMGLGDADPISVQVPPVPEQEGFAPDHLTLFPKAPQVS